MPRLISSSWWAFFAIALTGASGLGCSSGDEPFATVPPPAPLLQDRLIYSGYDTLSCSPCDVGIWTSALDGSDRRLLIGGLQWPSNPSVSPDRRSILYEDNRTLYLADAEGHHVQHLVTGLRYNQEQLWTPDGEWILFAGADSVTLWQLYRIRPDGTGRDRITSSSAINEEWPTLSRDGRFLAYIARDTLWHSQLVSQDLVTGDDQVVTDSTFAIYPTWAPDGRSLIFLGSDTLSTVTFGFWRLDLATKAYTYFGDPQGNRGVKYSPDGTRLLYGSPDLWISDSDGTHAHQVIADSLVHFDGLWTPAAP